MRNIDYAGLYQQVLEGEKKGQWDGLTQDERTKKEIRGNKARSISVAQAKLGKGTGKKGVAPVAPPNLAQEDIDRMAQAIIDDGLANSYENAITLLEFMSDEWFNYLQDLTERVDSKKPLNDLQKKVGVGEPAHEKPFIKKIEGKFKPNVDYKLRNAPQNKNDGKPPMI